ncbi:MAG: hypothetical protein ABIJ97_01055 [Bacteroidota bacterium]
MRNLLFMILCLGFVITTNAQTISDIFRNDTLNYNEIVSLIEEDDGEVFNNSEEYEQKRYNRWRSYWDTRVDSAGSFTAYSQA